MPIINMAFNPIEAAARGVNVRGADYLDSHSEGVMGPRPIWLYDTHVGLCLRTGEYNGYDDSDFYMEVWNPTERKVERIIFASTRGWTYPCYGSSADATPEVLEAYAQWKDAESRLAAMQNYADHVARLCDYRATCKALAKAAGVPVGKVFRLARTWGKENVLAVAKLSQQKLRSEFKINLKNQVIAWLADPAPKYRTPLSARQMQFI